MLKPALALLALLSMGLAACGPAPDDAAARVNRELLTQTQIDALLKRAPGKAELSAAQSEAAGRQVLERLIDQELAVQEAEAQRLGQDPAVQLQLEMARREVLARALAERLGAEVAKPTAEDIARAYREQPALYAERRLYALQELQVEADATQRAALRERLEQAGSPSVFMDWLKQEQRRFSVSQVLRSAEQLPPATLARLQAMKPGQFVLGEAPGGLMVLLLAGTQPQPLSEAQAQPLIEQRLLAERRAARVQQELRRLREAARVEYLGRYAQAPAAASAASAASAP